MKENSYCEKLKRWINKRMFLAALFYMLTSTVVFHVEAIEFPLPAETLQSNVLVKGNVKDANGEPLVGVGITVVDSPTKQTGTVSDGNGDFQLSVPLNVTIQFSYLGCLPQKIKVTSDKYLSVVMQADNVLLSDVVVVGYTTQRKRDISASVASIDMQNLEQLSGSSLTTLLAGQAPGLQSIIRSGVPGGATGGLVIRGNTSLSSSDGIDGLSSPLYIVDGIPMSLQDLAGFGATLNDFLSTMNPNDIKSIDILKDAAATAIYGSRGANGVIIITTKRGTSGKARVSANASLGAVTYANKMRVYTGEAERQKKLSYLEQSLTTLFGKQAWVDVRNGLEIYGYALPSVLTDKYNPAFNNAYDFQDLFYKTGLTQNYDVNIEGGSETSSYRVGAGYYNEDGVLAGFGFSRFSVNSSLINDLSKHLRNEFLIRYSNTDRKGGNNLTDLVRAMPTDPTNLPSSLYAQTQEELDRMGGQLGAVSNNNLNHDLALSDAIKIKFTDDLSLNTQASLSLSLGNSDLFVPSTARDDNKSYAESHSSSSTTFLGNAVLNYMKDIGDHQIIGMLGSEINTNTMRRSYMTALDGNSDYLNVIQGYKDEYTQAFSDRIKNHMASFFGLVSYGFRDNTYKVEGVLRRDGSSRFGQDNKWATFPSIKVHWAFSKEPWMQGASEWLDFGKLRFSWGKSGSIDGDPLLQYNSLTSIFNIGAGINSFYGNKMDVKSYGGSKLLVPDFDKIANRTLSWNKSKELNYGIDLELFNKRVFITGDIYSKYLAGLVYRSELPPYVGYNSLKSNLVDMVNNGFELGVTAYMFPRTNDFQWEWTLNLAQNKSVIAKLGNGGRDYINRDGNESYALVAGESAFQYFMLEYRGALNDYDDLPVNPVTGEAMKYYQADAGLPLNLQGRIFPGMPLFTDVNGDYLIDGGFTDNDKKIIANRSPEPKLSGGLHTNIRYKNLSLRVQSSFAFGHYIYNTQLQHQLEKFHSMEDFMMGAMYEFDDSKFWRSPNDGSYYPMLYVSYLDGGSARAFRTSSMYLEKGDYWSLDNVTLSYNIPASILSKMQIKGLNVYGTAQNLAMWKKSGVSDPRLVSKLGYYNGQGYPLSPVFTFGLQFKF
jgi:iron complex outermembrane receptor protein